jgi:sugar phosphate permease
MRAETVRPARYRWTILAVGVAAQASLSAVAMGLPALGPALRDAFDLSLAQVGIVLASVNWGAMGTLILWGALADRIGERTVIAAGLAGGALALVAASFADGFLALVFALAVTGALAASAAAASGRAVMGWFGRSERGFALGIRQMAVPIGGAAGALSLPVAVHLGGLDAAMLLLAAGCAIGSLLAAVWIREPPPSPANRPKATGPAPLRDRRIWRLSLGGALVVCAQVALLAFVVLFLVDERGLSAGLAAAALATIQVSGGLVRLVAGRWSDRAGRRVRPVRRLALAISAALVVLAIVTTAGAPLAVIASVLLLAGTLSMSWNGLLIAAAAEIAGRERAGTALGLQGTLVRLPGVFVGVAFGALVAAASWPLAFAVLSLLPLVGWYVLAPLEPEEEHRLEARRIRLTTPSPPLTEAQGVPA